MYKKIFHLLIQKPETKGKESKEPSENIKASDTNNIDSSSDDDI